jgi:hypothetical protein
VTLGVAFLALALLGFKPLALVLGVALLLGGIALLGSNNSTLDEIVVRITAAEARRGAMIDGLELRAVATD